MDSLSVIDVGCGIRPQGDVNVDLYIDGRHRDITDSIQTHSIANFIRADSLFLPFKQKAFEVAISNHTIEHTEQPYLFLRELQRVSRRIKMNVPLGCTMDWLWFRVHGHKWSLFTWWYHKVIPNAKVSIKLTWKRTLIRGKNIPLFIYPYLEIHVET